MRALARRVREHHDKGAFPGVRSEVHRLHDAGLVRLETQGRSQVVHLDMERSRDALARRDLRRMEDLIQGQQRALNRIEALHETMFSHNAAGILIEPERGLKANRLALIALVDQGHEDLLKALREFTSRHQTPIDTVPMASTALAPLIQQRAWNPLPDWIRTGIAFHHPQACWHALAGVTSWPTPTKAPSDADVEGALPRLGYREHGAPSESRVICVEQAAIQLLQSDQARRIAAAAVILDKNSIHAGLLHGMAKRSDTSSEVLTLLRLVKPDDPTIRLLEASGTIEARLDEDHIRSTLAKYA